MNYKNASLFCLRRTLPRKFHKIQPGKAFFTSELTKLPIFYQFGLKMAKTDKLLGLLFQGKPEKVKK